jgi:hypothetical protein
MVNKSSKSLIISIHSRQYVFKININKILYIASISILALSEGNL